MGQHAYGFDRLEKVELACHFAGPDTVVDAELVIDATHLCTDGVDRDDLFCSYFPIGTASNEQAQHTQFLWRERFVEMSGRERSRSFCLTSFLRECMQNAPGIGKQRLLMDLRNEGVEERCHCLSFIQKETQK